MAEPTLAAQRWSYGAAYLAIVVVIMLIHLVPLSIAPGRIPGPDLLICLTFAWIVRRPHYLPTLLVAMVFLMADMLFMRPPGLWAALVVIAVEILRARESGTREQTFLMEWAMITAVLLAMTLANRIVLTVFFVEQVSFGLSLVQFLATALCYPLVVFASRVAFGISKMARSQTDAKGRPR